MPAGLETPDRAQGKISIAITRDISSTGLLIFSRRELVVGELVNLTCVLDGTEHALSGKVVRVEPVDTHELWRCKAALAVDGQEHALRELQTAVAAQANPDA